MYHYMVQEDIWKHTTETVFGNLCRPVAAPQSGHETTCDKLKFLSLCPECPDALGIHDQLCWVSIPKATVMRTRVHGPGYPCTWSWIPVDVVM